jgi:glutaconate CoA-transferase subunit A
MTGKVTSMQEAISKFVKEGDTVFLSGAQHGEPSAAMHEIARQRIGHLTTISVLTQGNSIFLYDGLVDRIITGYYPQDEKSIYPLARARAMGKFPVFEESSHFAICLALMAGQMNVPFLPTPILLGSDMMNYNSANLKTVKCPFTGQTLAAVKAVQPDVAIIHCQRADAEGNAQKWGSLGVDAEGVGASKKVIVTTEEIVESDVIRRHPNMTIVPGFRVSAVVQQRYGAYPMHLAGCYNNDFRTFMMEMRGKENFETYMEEMVHGVSNWDEYIEKMKQKKGASYFDNLKIKNPLYSEPIVTGY